MIGASNDRRKFGNRAVRAFRQQGYTVIPINPHEREVEGLKAYASVLDVPGPIDMASFYVPPEIGEQVIDEVAQKGIAEVWLNPGSESDALIARARAAIACPSSPAASSPSARIPVRTCRPWPILSIITLVETSHAQQKSDFNKSVHAKQAPGSGADRESSASRRRPPARATAPAEPRRAKPNSASPRGVPARGSTSPI